MACPTLNMICTGSLEILLSLLSHNIGQEALQIHINNIMNDHPDEIQPKLAEVLHYHIGSKLAAQEDWNAMTFLQLDREARVHGLLGHEESHQYTSFHLRLLLMHEARKRKEAKATEIQLQAAARATGNDQMQESEQDLIDDNDSAIDMMFET